MNETKMVTEREAVRRERKAFVAGQFREFENTGKSERLAAELYPLPKIERPRVVRSANGKLEFRVQGGILEVRPPSMDWMRSTVVGVGDVVVVADLLANPTETVEDDGRSDG